MCEVSNNNDKKSDNWDEFIKCLKETNENKSAQDKSLDKKHNKSVNNEQNDLVNVNNGNLVIIENEFDDQEEKGFSRGDLSYINKLLNSKLIETKESDIEVLRSDPNHPLHSVKNFHEMNLKESILKGICAMGFYKPSAIQEKALPCILTDHPQNMIAQSQSGTGKTATFLLAMLSRVDPEIKLCQCLCMVPTRELAIQIANVAKQMSQFMKGIYIGQAIKGDDPLVVNGFVANQVVIGTPGTVFSWVRGTSSYRLDARKVKIFVLDEADIMMEEDGFLNITVRVKNKLLPSCQILLFSATYDEPVIEFAREIISNPVEIRVRRSQLTLKNIKQFYLCPLHWQTKYAQVSDIYGGFNVGQAIIFCATRVEARWLRCKMEGDGHKISMLTGELDVKEREKVITRFRRAENRVLITTNVCARGLDVPQVNLIINWNMPVLRNGEADCETYLHRIGRSGRFGKEGLAINFVSSEEMPLLRKIEQHFDVTIPLLTGEALEKVW